ncbi:hypothetical protein [Mesorhizobium sp. CN2-181]|uniref:hypothetical protein n=1 Tax=Mesorhizobium yinganensis TaxID=3157707 RepID=UPI0032B7A395
MAQAAVAGVSALTAPVGAYTVSNIGNMRRFDWPIAATSRPQLFDRLFAGSENLPSMVKCRAAIEQMAELDLDGIMVDAGLLDAFRGRAEFPLEGHCLQSIIGEAAERLVIDPQAPVRIGDVVMYAAAGSPSKLVKIFAGVKGGLAYFWCSHPETLLVYPAANILHVDKVAQIIDRDGTRWTPEPVTFEAFRAGAEWAVVPKDESIEIAAGKATEMIYRAARALPGTTMRTLFNDTIRELCRYNHPARFLPEAFMQMRELGKRVAEDAA